MGLSSPFGLFRPCSPSGCSPEGFLIGATRWHRRYYALNSEQILERRKGRGPNVFFFSLEDEIRAYSNSDANSEVIDVIDICAGLSGEKRKIIDVLIATDVDIEEASRILNVGADYVRQILSEIGDISG